MTRMLERPAVQTVSFAGTAKNTGKTTTALHMVDRCHARGLRLALTSIGYDGEIKDNVTGLPKPRYVLQPGDWVATAEKCLKTGTAGYRIRRTSSIYTVLGRIVFVEITSPGLVVLAGPNRRSDLEQVLADFQEIGVDWVLVDGALNRLAPMICTDGLVLSTGAAFTEDIPSLAEHARALCAMFRFPRFPLPPVDNITLCSSKSGQVATLGSGSLLSEAAFQALETATDTCLPQQLLIPNACHPARLQELLTRKPALREVQWVFGSPLKLLASGDPRLWEMVWASMQHPPQYFETLPLRCLTLNPFYPSYHAATWSYSENFLDANALLAAVRAQVTDVPVLNLRQPPIPDLLDLLTPSSAPS